jgi:hypothetical protein
VREHLVASGHGQRGGCRRLRGGVAVAVRPGILGTVGVDTRRGRIHDREVDQPGSKPGIRDRIEGLMCGVRGVVEPALPEPQHRNRRRRRRPPLRAADAERELQRAFPARRLFGHKVHRLVVGVKRTDCVGAEPPAPSQDHVYLHEAQRVMLGVELGDRLGCQLGPALRLLSPHRGNGRPLQEGHAVDARHGGGVRHPVPDLQRTLARRKVSANANARSESTPACTDASGARTRSPAEYQ